MKIVLIVKIQMKKIIEKNTNEFLQHSNWIESEYSIQALKDAKVAWKFAMENKDDINIKYVLEIHRLLCKNIRPDIAGKVRNCDVWIGGERKIFISVQLLEEEIDFWCKSLNKKLKIYLKKDNDKQILWVKKMHLKFEGIHPYEDGNGRTGRILMNIHRILLNLPLLIIHEGYDQYEYYQWFRKEIENPFYICKYCNK